MQNSLFLCENLKARVKGEYITFSKTVTFDWLNYDFDSLYKGKYLAVSSFDSWIARKVKKKNEGNFLLT